MYKRQVLAIFHVANHFEPQLWSYEIAAGTPEFEAVATPPNVMTLLSGDDWITTWFGLWARDLEIAMLPDEEVTIPQTDFTDKEEPSDTGGGGIAPAGDDPGGGDGIPGGSPGKRKPTSNPVKAPKGPGFK